MWTLHVPDQENHISDTLISIYLDYALRLNRSPFKDDIKTLWKQLETVLNQSLDSGALTGCLEIPMDAANIQLTAGRGDAPNAVESFNIELPISTKTATELYTMLKPSPLDATRGEEGPSGCHKVEAHHLTLPPALCTFDFPNELERLRLHLCPSAERVRPEVFELNVYGPGDACVPQREPMNGENAIGFLSVVLPVVDEVSVAVIEEDWSNWYPDTSPPPRPQGPLVLYAGYHASDIEWTETNTYRGMNCLTYSVGMKRDYTSVRPSGQKYLAMHYGAWTTDVLHEVREVSSGYHVVLTYRLSEVGRRKSFVPRPLQTSMGKQLCQLMETLQHLAPSGDGSWSYYIGICLRHDYGSKELVASDLKGIDAAIYNIVLHQFECCLFSGLDVRNRGNNDTHSLSRTMFDRVVFPTVEIPPVGLLYHEDTEEFMLENWPVMRRTAWIELGYGTLLAGYEWDDHYEFWYRQGYLLISREPSRWKRLRGLCLLMEKYQSSWGKLKGKRDIIEHIYRYI